MKTFNSLRLHVFSGTGNSLAAAGWLADLFGIDRTEIVRMRNGSVAPSAPPAGSITGFIFPTHGFTAPWAVLRYVARLSRGDSTAAFVIACRAGTWPGFLLPGLSGSAMFVVALLLLCKGYRLKGLRGLDMPSNWMSLHWGLSQKYSNKIIARAHQDIERLAAKLFSAGRHILSFNNIFELISGMVLLPISAGYLLLGRFGLAKLFYANWRCTSCGQCAHDCPVQAIVMKGRNIKKPYWTFACESCMHCMGYCPEKAVEASHPLAVGLYFFSSISLAGTLGTALVKWNIGMSLLGRFFLSRWVQLLVDYGYALVSFFIAYMIFYYLVRIPLINRLFSYLTLTHYYRRYHEPSITRKAYIAGNLSAGKTFNDRK